MPLKIVVKGSNKPKTLPKPSIVNADQQGAAGAPSAPQASPSLLIDKLAITLFLSAADQIKLYPAIAKLLHDSPNSHSHQGKNHYQYRQLIALQGSNETAHFLFGPKKGYLPDARLEFNPSKIGGLGLAELNKALLPMFPGGWGFWVKHGNVSRIDIAIDLSGLRMDQFHLLPAMALTSANYKSNGKLKTLYVGKGGGNQIKVYSKSAEQQAAGKPLPQPTVRVEKSLKPPSPKALKHIGEIKNPFAPMKLVETPAVPPPTMQWLWPIFLDSVRVRGLVPALKFLKPNHRTVFRKHFAAHQHDWWDPGAIWARWPEAIEPLLAQYGVKNTQF